ncbi:MAG: hypothetical protein ACYC2I_04335 [Elusimicrobiales bacterium]
MKKILIAVMAAAAGVSAASAQEKGVNFGGAAVPMPKMERAAVPQRLINLDGMSSGKLGTLLREAAGRNSNKDSQMMCSFAGPIELGDMVCGSECCLWDMDGDGDGDMTECHPIEPCFPKDKPEDKAAIKNKAMQFAEMVRGLKNKKKTRGPYEDCVNYCIDEWQSCTGDNCGKAYDRCLNVCDKVVND